MVTYLVSETGWHEVSSGVNLIIMKLLVMHCIIACLSLTMSTHCLALFFFFLSFFSFSFADCLYVPGIFNELEFLFSLWIHPSFVHCLRGDPYCHSYSLAFL